MIEVRNLQYTYRGANQSALNGLDLSVETGEIFGLLGPSGAGKSTTQKVLIGLLDDYTGECQVFDREVADWGSDYYERIGVSSETPTVYHKLTGRENLELFGSLYQNQSRDPTELLERVGLGNAIDRRVGAYSKGMRVRLNFVKALLHGPELVFLDEPTAGVDPTNARSIKSIIQELGEQGTTVFLTTHDMTVADQLCDRVGFIVEGNLPVIETPRTLKLDHGEEIIRVEYSTNGGLRERTFPLEKLDRNEEFQELLDKERIETIHTGEATLEDVFIAVTGRELT